MKKLVILFVMLSVLMILGACGNKYLEGDVAEVGEKRHLTAGAIVIIDDAEAKAYFTDFIKQRADGELTEMEKHEMYANLSEYYGMKAPLATLTEVTDKTDDGLLCKLILLDNDYHVWSGGTVEGWAKCDSFERVVDE